MIDIKSNVFKVDGLIEFACIDYFDDYGNYENSILRLRLPEYLLSDDFAFCYNTLNGMGYRLNTKAEFVHSLMSVYSLVISHIAKSVRTFNFVKDDDNEYEGYA